jgi:lysyl oxidase-like protein 2/3/4
LAITDPDLFAEIMKYGLDKNIVTASGTANPFSVHFNNKGNLETIDDPDRAAQRMDRLMKQFLTIDGKDLREIVPRPYDNFFDRETFEKYDKMTSQERIDAMDLSAEDKNLLETAISHLGLVTAAQVGYGEAAHWYSLSGWTTEDVGESMGTYRLCNGGTTSLAQAIMSEFKGDRLFNSPVTRITQTAEGATVETGGRIIKCRYVVCTLPLNVLQDVKFEPSLSLLRTEAASLGHPGRGGKLHYIVSPPLEPFSSMSTSPTELTFLFSDEEDHDANKSYIISFLHSQSRIKDLTDSAMAEDAFRAMLPPATLDTHSIQSCVYHDWRNDPYAKGTWCCFEAGYATKYISELQSRHSERVLMASSDWAKGWRGCIDGAIEQGARAAREVIDLLAVKEIRAE